MLSQLASHSLLPKLAALLVVALGSELRTRLPKASVAYLRKAALRFLPLLLHGLIVEVSLFGRHLAEVSRLRGAAGPAELLLLKD